MGAGVYPRNPRAGLLAVADPTGVHTKARKVGELHESRRLCVSHRCACDRVALMYRLSCKVSDK
jgi:hypothetical protein